MTTASSTYADIDRDLRYATQLQRADRAQSKTPACSVLRAGDLGSIMSAPWAPGESWIERRLRQHDEQQARDLAEIDLIERQYTAGYIDHDTYCERINCVQSRSD